MRWSPFPSVHERDRAEASFEPTRLGSIRIDALSVEDVNVAFNTSTMAEFNINHFVRGLAEGKVSQELPRNWAAPNTLSVTVVSAKGVAKHISPRIKLTLRDATWETSARQASKQGERRCP